MDPLPLHTIIWLVCWSFWLFPFCASSGSRLLPDKPLSVGSTITSDDGTFALGFFSPSSSGAKQYYIGIWYNNIPERTHVWVANHDNPITNASPGKLVLTNNSDLVLSDSRGLALWTTKNNFTSGTTGTSAVLLNSGNLVIRLPNGTDIWQSFHYPTDTILPNIATS